MTADSIEDALEAEFAAETDANTAATAAGNLAAMAEAFDIDRSAAAVADRVADAPYDEFERRFNYVVGDIAQETEDCTDSREYRLAGYGDVGSRGTWAAQ